MTAPTTIRDDTAARHKAKYANRNPVHRLTLGRFHDALAKEIKRLAPATILDFGCGEGLLTKELEARGLDLGGYAGVDIRGSAIAEARDAAPARAFHAADIFAWPEDGRRFEMVLASQVLEHLHEPERYLARLVALCSGTLVLTVPHEPWFQLMNLIRGRDLIRLGNHPEHINHWNAASFSAFVAPYAEVQRMRTIFPFLIAVATPRRS